MRDSRDNIDWLQPVNLDAPLNEGLRYWGLAAGPLFGGNRLWDACGQFHGSMVGNAAFSTASPVPGFGSIALDGTGDYVNLGRVRAMEITGDISCFCWLKTTTVGGPAEIVSAINTGAFTGWALENNGGMIALWDGAAFRTASTYINDGNWNYIGFSTRGATVELFVNGKMVSSQATSSPRSGTANGSDVNLGGWQTYSRANNGNLSDVRFYNRGLSTAEACALYDAARNGWRDELRRLVSRRAATAIDPPVALTANSVSAGAPTVGSPALGQVQVLTATSVATSAPSVGTPALGQTHVLAATGVASGAPSAGSPSLGQSHALTASSVSSGSPTVGTPAIGQIHALTATSVASGTPTVGSPTLAESHALTADSVSSGAPTVGSPSLGVVHNLTANGVSAGSPTVGTPALGQLHALIAAAVASGAPAVGSPILGQVHVLLADGVSSGAPSVGSPVLAILGAPAAAAVMYTARLASSAPKLSAVCSTRPQSAAVPRSNPR